MSPAGRVVIVDDSAMMRHTVADALSGVRDLSIVGEASSGPEAIEVIARLQPDIVSLDIELPGFNGLTVLAHVMKNNATRVILVSSYTTAGAETTIEGLALGALDFVPKPSATEGLDVFKLRLRRTFRSALAAKLPNHPGDDSPLSATAGTLRTSRLAVVASSTGGPRALNTFFAELTTAPQLPILVVQHMPPGFTEQMARRLDGLGPVRVSEGADGDPLEPGKALVAPGSAHMEIAAGRVHLSDDPPIGGLRPRADVTMRSVAQQYGADTLGIVLTGMGTDGLIGCREIKRAGGQVIAQDAASSTVDGMPHAVRQAGIAEISGPPAALAKLLLQAAPHRGAGRPLVHTDKKGF